MNTSQTYAQRQQIIQNMASAAESNILIHIEQMTPYGMQTTNLESLLSNRKRIAQRCFELAYAEGIDINAAQERTINEFIYINEKIKLILGL
jgi:hypothetical protein